MSQAYRKVRTPHFPLYSEVRHLLRLWDGIAKKSVYGMIKAIQAKAGTPRKPMDWSDPDAWIKNRLDGDHAAQAMTIWTETEGTVNPRHVYGSYLFITNNDLLANNVFGNFQLSPKGRAFLDNDPRVVRELDDSEGLPQLLGLLAGKTRAKRGAILPEWQAFLREHSGYSAPATIRETLRLRLLNLVERGYVNRESIYYIITNKGIDYADRYSGADLDAVRDLILKVKTFNNGQQESARNRLASMPAQRFEGVIKELLAALEYEDIRVVRERGAWGFEVHAVTRFGITTVTEVFHFSRQIGRSGLADLERLQESLARNKSNRGTLLSLGSFTREAREAAAANQSAIRLLDGPLLLDLLAANKIGFSCQQLSLLQIDEDFFKEKNMI